MFQELREPLNRERIKMNPHVFYQRKTMYKPYCRKCGLLWLNNQASQKAIRKECKYKDED